MSELELEFGMRFCLMEFWIMVLLDGISFGYGPTAT